MELTNAEAALLGLLSEEAMHPYRIEKEVTYRDMRFWTELSMSSIYKHLRKLEQNGLVESKSIISEQNRARKHYQITPAGTVALENKIKDLLSTPEHVRWEFDIGIYNADVLSREEVHKALQTYRGKLEEKRHGYEQLKQFLVESGCPRHRWSLAERPIRLLTAELEWVDSLLNDN